jgi:very-short-patch-repair endonuclease
MKQAPADVAGFDTRGLSVDRAVISVASMQHGCISTRQLLACGMAPSTIQARVSAGRLTRVHRGVYALLPGPRTAEQRCIAGLLAVGEGAALSHLTVAIMRGWWQRTRLLDIDVTCGRRSRVPGVRDHFSGQWEPALDAELVGGMAMTTGERTVLDLGSQLDRYQLTNVIKEAAFWGHFDVGRFDRAAERLGQRPGSALARGAVASFLAGCAGTRSALEDQMIGLIRASRLELPDEAGAPIGPHEVDLVWWRRRLIIEVDGPGHAQPNSRKKDPARDADLTRREFRVARFGHSEIEYHPFAAITRLERLLVP